MSVAAARSIVLAFSGDQVYQVAPAAASNSPSPAAQEVQTFTGAGDNTITVPTAIAPTGVTIVPPAGNTQTMTLKGVAGDTGIALHLTDPTSIGLKSTVASFVLTVTGTITGVRFIWT
jgi:hypothetical protein